MFLYHNILSHLLMQFQPMLICRCWQFFFHLDMEKEQLTFCVDSECQGSGYQAIRRATVRLCADILRANTCPEFCNPWVKMYRLDYTCSHIDRYSVNIVWTVYYKAWLALLKWDTYSTWATVCCQIKSHISLDIKRYKMFRRKSINWANKMGL